MVERDNLQDSDPTDVAWVEVSKFSGKQTFVEFYYAPHDPALTSHFIIRNDGNVYQRESTAVEFASQRWIIKLIQPVILPMLPGSK